MCAVRYIMPHVLSVFLLEDKHALLDREGLWR